MTEHNAAAKEEPRLDARIRRKIIIVCLCGAIGGFLFGYDTAVINGAVDSIAGSKTGFNLSNVVSGLSVSCALLGCVIGAWFAGKFADRFGRVFSIRVAAIIFVIASIGSALAPEVVCFICFRFLGGLAVGMVSVIGPIYIAEISPTKMRGFLTSFQQFAIGLGMFSSVISNRVLAAVSGGADQILWFNLATWRWMLLIMLVPSVIMLAVSLGLPESPRYLVMKGQKNQAGQVLRNYNGLERPQATIARIEASLRSERQPRFADLKGKMLGLKKIVWVGILIALFQQFCGVNVILYYDSSLWRSLGFSEQAALDITVWRTIAAFVPTILAMFLIDRIGRKKLLICGSAAMTLFLAVAALGFANAQQSADGLTLVGIWAPITIVAVYAFYLSFCGTWGPAMWVVLGEVFPNSIRGVGIAVATAFNWIGNFFVSTTFPSFQNGLGVGPAYLLYAVFSLLSLLFVWKMLPETNGVALEDMSAE